MGPGALVTKTIPIPRKLASRTKFVALFTRTLFAPTQRIGEFHQQHEEAGEDGPGRAGGLSRALAVARSLDGSGGFPGRRLSGSPAPAPP